MTLIFVLIYWQIDKDANWFHLIINLSSIWLLNTKHYNSIKLLHFSIRKNILSIRLQTGTHNLYYSKFKWKYYREYTRKHLRTCSTCGFDQAINWWRYPLQKSSVISRAAKRALMHFQLLLLFVYCVNVKREIASSIVSNIPRE